MADATVSVILQILLEKATYQIREEFKLAWGVDEELNKLSRALLRIQAVLKDAEEREIKEEAVRLWLKDLKDIAYDAEDILDEFETYVQQKKLERGAQREQVCNFLSCFILKDVKLQYKIGRRISKVTERLDEIAKARDALNLNEGGGHGILDYRERPQTSSFIVESNVFGRDDEKKEIIELLISEEHSRNSLSIISIFGMGGIGKTTLAQLVYNDEMVKMHFVSRMWVSVSDDFDVRRVTKSVIESINTSTPELMDLDPLQATLEKELHGKRFLLVLDDVWNENRSHWDVLQVPFRVGAQGSKIIVTTRSEKVSSIMGATSISRLEGLSSNDCWSLFRQYAFPRESLDISGNLETIGKEIVNKCKGLPLAIKTLGGLLHSKADENEWDAILKTEIWDLPINENNILPALTLSYHHLPTQVKQCFAYCSIFPKDYGFEKDKLVQLWMAEGFIQQKGRKRMEDTGGEYFEDLLWRSFLQYSHTDWEDQPVYKMHHLIHDLAEYVSGDECFRIENVSCNIFEKAHHASLFCDKSELKILLALYKCKSLRTLLLFSADRSFPTTIGSPFAVPQDMFLKLRCLRVLDLSSTSITELPKSIGNLKHLRYLDLSRSRIKRLPESTASLYNLQTLKLNNCPELLELPRNLRDLVNLRHLYLHTQEHNSYSRLPSMPSGIRKLTCLQTLSIFVVSMKEGCRIGELKDMKNLRGSICISKLEDVTNKEEAKSAELKNKKHLHQLELQWNTHIEDEIVEDVLEGLEPHKNLKKLGVFQYGGIIFPGWVGQPSFTNLETVYLHNCRSCTTLPPLGKLPMLKELYIHGMPSVQRVGHEFYGDGIVKGFPLLEMLDLKDLPALEQWSGVEEGELARLREFELTDCTKLKKFPYLPPTLTTLSIQNCEGLAVIPKLKNLADLELYRCDEKILRSLTCCTSLSSLSISGFPKLKTLSKVLSQSLLQLKNLYISNLDELTTLSEEATQWDLPALERLVISHCPQLTSLPKLQNLTSLQELEISDCNQLASMPELGLLITLRNLRILNCPLLKEQCQKEQGDNWCKIAHIPYIEVDGAQIC